MTPVTQIVDVIIPVYNQIDYVTNVLNSLFACEEVCDFVVTVIDDCSTDPNVTALLRRYADSGKISLHVNERNLGFTGSVCVGMKLNTDRDVVLLNSDTEVYSNWLSRMRRVCSEQSKVCSISPFSNHSSISSYPTPFTDNKEPLEISYGELAGIAAAANDRLNCETLTTSGFCMYITRASMNCIGYFDADAFPRGYGEETDFCIRARKMGWRHFVATDVFVRHASSASFGDEKHALNERAMACLFAMHSEYENLLKSSAVIDRQHVFRARIDYKRIERFVKAHSKLEFVIRTDEGDQFDRRDDTCYVICTGSECGLSKITLFPHIDVPNIPDLRLTATDFELAEVLRNLPVDVHDVMVVARKQRPLAFEWVRRLRNAMVIARVADALSDPAFDGEIKVMAVDEDAKRYVAAIPCVGTHSGGQQELKALFLKIVESTRPDLFLDLGANKGEVGVAVKEILPQCDVHSFEAAPSLNSDLEQSLTHHGVCVHNYAVTETDGDVALYAPRMLSWYYLRGALVRAKSYPKGHLGNSSLRKRSEYAAYDTEIVSSVRIDSFLRRHNLGGRIAVWIDCEGAALEVLRGFGKALDLVDLIHVELEAFSFWEGQALVPQIVDFLVERHFEPVLRDSEYGEWQFNCIFMRRSLRNQVVGIIRNDNGHSSDDVSITATTHSQFVVDENEANLAKADIKAIPIFVPCFNNATYCDSMLKQLLSLGFKNITFVDNASSASSMLKWLDGASKYASVEVMAENLGPKNSIFTHERLSSLPRWFCVTDPDLQFNVLLPDGWLDELAATSERFHAGKVGFALNVSDRAIFRTERFDIGDQLYHVWDWEKQFWKNEIGRTKTGDSLYYADIDTTFALYDKNFFDVDNNFPDGIRVGGRYTALHLPWYKNNFVDPSELEEYRSTQRFSYYHR